MCKRDRERAMKKVDDIVQNIWICGAFFWHTL